MGEDARVAEIEQLFDAKGWRLFLEEEDGKWEAFFSLRDIGGTATSVGPFASRRAAAEAAWAKYQREPWLGGGS